jgi:hypothetical protein
MGLFEFRILNPSTGKPDIVLPDVESFTMSPAMSDVGTVQFTYPKNGLNYSQIQNDRDLYVFFNGVEALNLRSTLEQSQGDDASLAEEGDLKTFNGRSTFSHFDRAIVYPSGWPSSTDPPTQAYSAVTVGQVLVDLIQKAQARGTIPEITWSFTATHDSAGNAWSNITISFNAQTTYLTCFQTMVGYALCDLKMVGYRLDAYVFQQMGIDHTTVQPPLVIRKGRDLTQAQQQQSTMGLSTSALVAGDNNTYVEVNDLVNQSIRGRREIGYSQSGVQDLGTLDAVGIALLSTVSTELKSRTLQLNFADPKCPMPIQDFDIGDWTYVDLNDGSLTRQRVVVWSVSLANDGTLTGTVTLDTIFQEKINRINGRLNALQNGVVLAGASNPTPVSKLIYPPKVPTGLVVGTSVYQDDQGHTFGQATITWTAVTQNTNNQPESDLANYAIRNKLHASSAWSPATLVDPSLTAAYMSPFVPNTSYDFQISAIDTQGNVSGWSTTVTVTMSADTTAPNQPSTPSVSSRLGQLSVVWDGKDSGAAMMPPDFDHTNVYVSASGSGFTPSSSNLFGTMRVGQALQIPGSILTYGSTYFVKLIAVDKSGNLSVASVAGSATLSQVVSTDLGTGQVSLGNLAFSDMGNLIDNGSFEDPSWQTIRNAEFGGTHWSLDSTTAFAGTTSIRHTGAVGSDETVILNSVTAKQGQTFMGAVDIKMDSSVNPSMRVALGVIWRDLFNNSIAYQDLVYNWNAPSSNDNIWRARVTGTGVTAPYGTVKADFVLATSNHTAGNVWFDNVEVRMQIDTLIVADAAITNAKIVSLTADKITAGTINAGIVLAGQMETASSGGRVLIDGPSDTVYIYDSTGVAIGTFGVNGLQLFVNPGNGSLIIDHAAGSTSSPILNFTANASIPPTTPSQIYANVATLPLGGGLFGEEEGIVIKSASQSDGSFVRIVVESGISNTGTTANGNLLYSNGTTETNMLSWGSFGLKGFNPGMGSGQGPVLISNQSSSGYVNFATFTSLTFVGGLADYFAPGQYSGAIATLGNCGATQIQVQSLTYNAGTGVTDILIAAWTPTGGLFAGTGVVNILAWQ